MRRDPADIRNAILAAAAALTAGLAAPALPFIGLPLAAFALGWITYRHGTIAGVLSAFGVTAGFAAFALVAKASLADVAFLAPALLAVGPGIAWAVRRNRAVDVVIGATLLLVAAVMAPIAIEAIGRGMGPFQMVAASLKEVTDAAVTTALARPGADSASVRQGAEFLLGVYLKYWPTLVFWQMAFAALLSVRVVSRVGRGLGLDVSALAPLPEIDLPFHLVWPAIVGLAMVAFGTFAKQPDGWADAFGSNVLQIVRPALFIQGAGVFAALYKRAGIGRFSRGFGFVLLGLSELVVPSVSVLGIADIFFNLRKLPRAGTGTAAGQA